MKWLTTKEILKIDGMPTTIQGVHVRAKSEKWRKRKPEGVKGREIEYEVPIAEPLECKVQIPQSEVNDDLLLKRWTLLFNSLSEDKIEGILDLIESRGTDAVLIPNKIRNTVMVLEQLPEASLKEISILLNYAQYCALTDQEFKVSNLVNNLSKATG